MTAEKTARHAINIALVIVISSGTASSNLVTRVRRNKRNNRKGPLGIENPLCNNTSAMEEMIHVSNIANPTRKESNLNQPSRKQSRAERNARKRMHISPKKNAQKA
jgi:hypothetical protein